MNVYVLRYTMEWNDTDLIQVYDSLQGVMNRLAITQLHDNLDEGEIFTIGRMDCPGRIRRL